MKNETSGPVRHSSRTTRAPASPNARSSMAARMAASAAAASGATTTPLPAARPSALTTTASPNSPRRTTSMASAAEWQTRYRAVGTPCRDMNTLANALLVSSCAAARVGPNSGRPDAPKRSATPAASGASGPTTVRSTFSRVGQREDGVGIVQLDRYEVEPCARCRHCRARTRHAPRRGRAPAANRARARAPRNQGRGFSCRIRIGIGSMERLGIRGRDHGDEPASRVIA